MVSKESKLIKDNSISFFILDNKAYTMYVEILNQIRNDSEKRRLVAKIISDLSLALQRSQYKFQDLIDIDIAEVCNIYNYTVFENQSIKKSKENLLIFLEKIKILPGSINDGDLNYLLDFYFYYTCVVSFNKYWYLQPQIPISNNLIEGLINHSLRLKQIYRCDSSANILEPIRVNFIAGGYNKLSDISAEEFLSTIMLMPMLDKEHPRNIEAKYFITLRRLLNANPSYSLYVFYIP